MNCLSPTMFISDDSADGKLVAFGSSDYTIGVIDSQTLAVSAH